MGRNSKKKKGSASRRKGRSRATPNDQFGEDDQDLLSEEITALSAIFQEDFQILSRSSQTHISINLRPHSDATGYENQDVSAILSVRCLPGYPFKCPKLQVEPEKGLMQVDVDKLLSLLLDQANSNSREGRVMIFNLVEVAQEFLSEILSAQETIDCASSLVSGDKEGWPMTCGSSGYVKESFVSGLYDLFSEFCGDDGSWYHGIGTVVNDDKKKIARDHIFDINKDQQSTVSVHKIDTSRIGNVVPRMHQFLNYESRIVDVSRDIQIPSILDKSYNPKEGMADRNGSTSSEFSTTSPWVKSIREDLEEEKQTKGVINPMAKDLGIDQQMETSYSGLEDQTSNILATSSLLDDKKDLFMAYLLRLSCSTKGSLTLALPEITSELCNLGMLSEKARDLSSEPPSTFNKKFNSTFQPLLHRFQSSGRLVLILHKRLRLSTLAI